MKQKNLLVTLLCLGLLNNVFASEDAHSSLTLPRSKKGNKKKFSTFNPTTPAVTTQPEYIQRVPSSSFIGSSALVLSTSPQSHHIIAASSVIKNERFTHPSPSIEDNSNNLPRLDDVILLFQELENNSRSSLDIIKEANNNIEVYTKILEQCRKDLEVYSGATDNDLDVHKTNLKEIITSHSSFLNDSKESADKELTEEEARHQQIVIAINSKFQQIIDERSSVFNHKSQAVRDTISTIETELNKLIKSKEKAEKNLQDQHETKNFLKLEVRSQIESLNEQINRLQDKISETLDSEIAQAKKDLYQINIDQHKEVSAKLSTELEALTLNQETTTEEAIPTFPTVETSSQSTATETQTEKQPEQTGQTKSWFNIF
ncbi:hypothetical protein EBU24_05245 [bacterium]|nr:hypothetical protein [bacterium]